MTLTGKRTYMAASVIILLALCQKFLGLQVPSEIWIGLFALLAAFLRAGLDGLNKTPLLLLSLTLPPSIFILLPSAFILLLFCGCTYTHMETLEGGGYALHRFSVLQKIDIPQITVLDDGSVSLDRYASDGGNSAIGTAVEAAVKAGINGAKGGL
jgi:hypothetical protein